MESYEEGSEELAIIVEAVTEILDVLHNTGNSIRALETLSACTAYVLCNGMASARDADNARNMFVHTLDRAMDKAEDLGATIWTRGTYQ